MRFHYEREGNIEMNKQISIEKSAYQRYLDEGQDDTEGLRYQPHPEKHESQRELLQSVRYWSDFNRVFHLPRSLHPLSSVGTSGNSANHVMYWAEGISTFERECLVGCIEPWRIRIMIPDLYSRTLILWTATFESSSKSAISCRSALSDDSCLQVCLSPIT